MSEPIHTGEALEDTEWLSLRELCRRCDVHAELVVEMVQYGALQPQGREPAEWRFSPGALERSRRLLRLSRDLQINLPGAALSLELLDELGELRGEVARLRRRLAAHEEPPTD